MVSDIVKYSIYVDNKQPKEIRAELQQMGYHVDKKELKRMYNVWNEEKKQSMETYVFQQSFLLVIHFCLILSLLLVFTTFFHVLGLLLFLIGYGQYVINVLTRLNYVCHMVYDHSFHPKLYWEKEEEKRGKEELYPEVHTCTGGVYFVK